MSWHFWDDSFKYTHFVECKSLHFGVGVNSEIGIGIDSNSNFGNGIAKAMELELELQDGIDRNWNGNAAFI